MGKKRKEEFIELDTYFSAVKDRIVDALNRAGIKSKEDLSGKSEDDLLAFFGLTSDEAKSITDTYKLSPKTNAPFSWGLSMRDYSILDNHFKIKNATAFMMLELDESKKRWQNENKRS